MTFFELCALVVVLWIVFSFAILAAMAAVSERRHPTPKCTRDRIVAERREWHR